MLFPTYMGDLKKRENRFREFDRFYKLSRKYTARNIEQADSEYDLFLQEVIKCGIQFCLEMM